MPTENVFVTYLRTSTRGAIRAVSQRLRGRDLGLGYFDLATNTHDVADYERAYQILSQLPPGQQRALQWHPTWRLCCCSKTSRALPLRCLPAFPFSTIQARYAYYLGAALGRVGKTGEAITALRRSIRLDPSQPYAYVALAEVYRTAGQEAEPPRHPRVPALHAPERLAAPTGAGGPLARRDCG
jgi:hypothetical protein